MSIETDLAWAAGLFEGEGSIYLAKLKGYEYIRIQLKTTDLDVLERFHKIVKVGKIYKHKGDKPSHYKQSWYWQLSTLTECQLVMCLFWQYLGNRRKAKAIELKLMPGW